MMRIRLDPIDLCDDVRRALNAHRGLPGLATRETIRAWVDSVITATLEDICSDYDREED
jgi:hypothetical protein